MRVHLDSAKLTFPDGADQDVTLKPGSTTIRVQRRGTRVGHVPDDDRVTSRDGRLAFGAPVRSRCGRPCSAAGRSGSPIAALVFLAGVVGQPLPPDAHACADATGATSAASRHPPTDGATGA